MAIEIVDLPMQHGGSSHSNVNVYQRVMVKHYGFLVKILPETNPMTNAERFWGKRI